MKTDLVHTDVSKVLQPDILLEFIFHWCPERVDLMGSLINIKTLFLSGNGKNYMRKLDFKFFYLLTFNLLNDVQCFPITTENLADGDDMQENMHVNENSYHLPCAFNVCCSTSCNQFSFSSTIEFTCFLFIMFIINLFIKTVTSKLQYTSAA